MPEEETPRERAMFNIRKVEELYERLEATCPDKPVLKRLKALYERTEDDLNKPLTTIQNQVEFAPRTLAQISKLTGEPADLILQAVARTSHQYKAEQIPWTAILDIVRSYEVNLQELKKKGEK